MSDRQKALTKMRKRATGTYQKVKDTEAQAGGRRLPGGLENETAQITGCKIDMTEKGNDPYIYLYARAITPEQYLNVNFGFIYVFADSEYQTYDDVVTNFTNDMKLLGFDAGSFEDEISLMEHVDKTLAKSKPKFLYNTSGRPKKDGTYRAFIAGLDETDGEPEEEDQTTNRRPRRGKPQAAAPFAVGDKVETSGDYYQDGNTYSGEVIEVDDEGCEVKFDDDGGVDAIPFANLVKTAPPPSRRGKPKGKPAPAEEDPIPFEEGDAVITINDYFENGEDYEGVILEIDNEEKTITVQFEDEITYVPLEYLRLAD